VEKELNIEEISIVVRAAHAVAPAFNEDALKKLFETEKRLVDSGFVSTAWSLHRLEKEKGITLEQAPAYHEKLVQDFQKLQKDIAMLQEAHKVWNERVTRDREASQRATQERTVIETKLTDLRKATEKETKQLELQMAQARRNAGATISEIEDYRKLKAELTSRDLTMKFLLDLCRGLEITPDARERLETQIEVNESLASANAVADKELGAKNQKLAQCDKAKADIETECQDLQKYLDKLKVDSQQEEKIHTFYQRFGQLGPILENIVSWDQVGFIVCEDWACGSRFWVNKDKSTLHLRPGLVCPACGGNRLQWDFRLYAFLGLTGREGFIKLLVGG